MVEFDNDWMQNFSFAGSVYKFHPNFGQKMKATARKLVCNCIDFKMVLSEDGSGRGAALAVAAQTSKFQHLV